MTIKVKLRGDKAIARFNNQMDESYFVHVIRSARDNGQPHPTISLKGADGREIPPRKPEKPLPKEQLEKLEVQVGKPVKVVEPKVVKK